MIHTRPVIMVSDVNKLAHVGVRHKEIPTFYDGEEELRLTWKSEHMIFDDSPRQILTFAKASTVTISVFIMANEWVWE